MVRRHLGNGLGSSQEKGGEGLFRKGGTGGKGGGGRGGGGGRVDDLNKIGC
jgi:hypothetical protein